MAVRWIARAHALAGVLLLLAAAPRASAGPYADALGKCLVDSTTSAEKMALVRWMFSMMALHPEVQSSSTVTPQQRTAMSKQTAHLYERLLTEACASRARDALRHEGRGAIPASFDLLGKVAARELFTHPKVVEGLSEFSRYVDQNKLKELTRPPKL